MPDLSPADVAHHWPFVRRKLFLARWCAGDRALQLLAQHQAASGGEPAELGRARIGTDLGLTAGEAGNVWRALSELETRQVVTRHRGCGRRPDAWSLRPEIGRWRGLPWETSGRDVESAVSSCICRADSALAARFPGQRGAKPRGVWLSAADHLQPPGLFLVDSRGNGERRAANANGRAYDPVDSRGNGAPSAAPIPLLLDQLEKEKALRAEKLIEAVERANPGKVVFGEPEARLRQLADLLSDAELEELAYRVRHLQEPGILATVELACGRLAAAVT